MGYQTARRHSYNVRETKITFKTFLLAFRYKKEIHYFGFHYMFYQKGNAVTLFLLAVLLVSNLLAINCLLF